MKQLPVHDSRYLIKHSEQRLLVRKMIERAQRSLLVSRSRIAEARVRLAIPIVILLSCCDNIQPSTQSRQFEAQVVPRLTAWSRSKDPELKLSTVVGLRGYDAVCLVPEYNCLDSLEKNAGAAGVKRFHSSFGKCVPENKLAIVFVANGEGHAALLDRSGAFSNTLFRGTCAKAQKALFHKTFDPRAGGSVLKIEEE